MKAISKNVWLKSITMGVVTIGAVAVASQASAAYKATVYVAGMGGHFAKAEVTIDPAASQPIKIENLTKVDIGDKDSHPTHDIRIDGKDRDTAFWSTYKIDPKTGKAHVGKTDLKTGQKTMDVDIDVPAEATATKSLYCGSGQNASFFLPISMAHKGYIDVINKSDMQRTQRLFLEGTEADIGAPYKFYHGTNSPDGKKLLVTINEAVKDNGDTVGKMHLVELDMDSAVQGKIKVLQKGMLPGKEKKTISFRQYYSNDGSLIANSGGDTMFLVNAKDLSLIDAEPMGALEENHDAMFTPDDKYIVATSRTKAVNPNCENPQAPKEGEFLMDGVLKLYDVAAKKFIGEHTSVCQACHKKEGIDQHAVLCGLDANFQKL